MQQGKLGDRDEVKIEIRCVSSAGRMKEWRSSTWVRGEEYTWLHTATKEKTAFHEAAAKLLEELVPGKQGGGK